MNCRSVASLFSAFIDDELSQSERRDFESHLLGCRRCSQSLRELKGAMALVLDTSVASSAETSPHFEDDLMARIRSGEAMRPSVIEWLQGLLTPERLRPAFMLGAGACAVFLAVVLFQGSQSTKDAPSLATPGTAIASVTPPASSAPVMTPSDAAPVIAAPAASTTRASAPRPASRIAPTDGPNGIVEIADRVVPSARAGADASSPDSQFVDEYVTDQFFLQRGVTPSDPTQSTIVPVTDKTSDDVYIEF